MEDNDLHPEPEPNKPDNEHKVDEEGNFLNISQSCGLTRTLGAGTKGCWKVDEGKGVLVLVLGITMWLAYR